jgi:hypothetical protein
MFVFPELPAFLDRSRPEVADAVARAEARADVQTFFVKEAVETRGTYVVDVLPPLPGAKPRLSAKPARKVCRKRRTKR